MSIQNLIKVAKLKSKDGEVETASLEGKTVLLYFSAHWCPPCRNFTPKLAKFYKEQRAAGRNDFEIVFVTGDRSEKEFEEYYSESHPWLAIPFAEKKAMAALNKRFKVQGIPSLIVVGADGNTITKSGTEMVQRDPEGKEFPWAPKTTYEILADAKMTAKDGQPLTVDDLKKTDAFALYFSAHWCPPCRAFTPQLASVYKAMKAAGKNVEFVFVSSDRDEDQYKEYRDEMPWAAMSFQDPVARDLKGLCEVNGIPSLATFKGSDGSIINTNARGGAADDESGENFPWEVKPLPPCSDFTASDEVIEALNSEICVILNINGAADAEAAKAAFSKAAEKTWADFKAAGEEPDVFFFTLDSNPGKDLYGRVLSALKVSEPAEGKVTVLAMNIQNDRASVQLDASKEVTTDNVLEMVAAFKDDQ